MYRTKLYFFGCVLFRLALGVIILLGINPKAYRISIFGCLSALMTLGFTVKFIRKDRVGFFGGEVWWQDLRRFHALIAFITSILLFFDVRYAGVLVIYDIIPGLLTKYNSMRQEPTN